MNKGCLLITNNVAAAQEDEFNAWYQGEHLDDRLGVPGFLSARRFRAIDAPQRYAAVYETTSPDVLLSPSYAALLRAPSPRTSAIMPAFQDVTRIIGSAVAGESKGTTGIMALCFITRPNAVEDDARRVAAIASGTVSAGLPPDSVRTVVVLPDPVGVDTPESRMRPVRDRRADLVLMAEWLEADGHTLRRLRNRLADGGWQVEDDRGGLYELLCCRWRTGG